METPEREDQTAEGEDLREDEVSGADRLAEDEREREEQDATGSDD